MNRLSWKDKYHMALQENLTIKDIMLLRDCGQPKATAIRDAAVQYCIDNKLETTVRGVNTEAVFETTGFDLQYYYNKMMQEQKYLTCLEV